MTRRGAGCIVYDMDNELELLKKRLAELSKRAAERGICTHSEFLSLGEQTELSRLRLDAEYTLDGGWAEAERRAAVFGGDRAPLCCLEISPVSRKFAEPLTHRDYLGSLMGLGLRRSVLGDVVLCGDRAYVFCLESVRRHIIDGLTQVRRTQVRVTEASSLPEEVSKPPEPTTVNAASERLDAVVSAVFDLSRAESQRLFEAERVQINGLTARSVSARLEPGMMVSVRGHGRFRFEGTLGETRKGRLRLRVRKY